MKRKATLALVFMLAATLSFGAYAGKKEEKASAKKAVEDVYAKVAVCLNKKDANCAAKNTHKDATLLYKDGLKLTIKQWAELSKIDFKRMDTVKATFDIDCVKVKDGKAIAKVKEVDEYTLKDKNEKGNVYKEVSKWVVTFVQVKNGWLPIEFIEKSQDLYKNGKKINLKKIEKEEKKIDKTVKKTEKKIIKAEEKAEKKIEKSEKKIEKEVNK